jgi:hypothetical protein
MTDLEKQLYTALKLLATEVELSGNGGAQDFGWRGANRVTREALGAYESAKAHEDSLAMKTESAKAP